MTFCPRSLRTTKVLHPDGGGSICVAKYNRFCLVAAPDDSVPILLQALEKDTVYGGVIFACLERCGAQPDVVPLLVKAATGPRRDPSDKWDSRDDALFALGNLRPVDRRAVAALIEVAKGPDPQLRWWAIEPLEKIGVADERVLPALTELVLLPARDGQHREEAADAIPGEDCPFEGPHRDDEKYRESAADNAAKAISRLGVDDATMEALITASSHPEPTVRRLAVRVLGEAGPKAKRAVTALIARMRDDEALVRDSARVALARLGPLASDAVPALIADIDKYEGYWQQSPAWVLSEIGPSAVPALIKRLKETKADELKEWDAHESLFRFREKARSAVPDLVEMLDRNDFRTRINLLRILEGIGPAAAPAVPKLAAMLNPPADPDEFGGNVAFFAQRALIAIGEDAVPVFVSRLELDDKQQRQNAFPLRSSATSAVHLFPPTFTLHYEMIVTAEDAVRLIILTAEDAE